jgi:hypothetical protein
MTLVRYVSCTVTLNDEVLTDVVSARGEVVVDNGWPTCSVFVRDTPVVAGSTNGPITVVAGATIPTTVTRFTGQLRRIRPTAFPKAIELVSMGTLAYAAEWAPDVDIEMEEIFPDGATDQELVCHCLDQVPQLVGTYTVGDIGGRGEVLGLEIPENFNWSKGTSAWSRIQEIDKATLYRTYQTREGTIRRIKMIGHPNDTEDFTLGPADCLEGSQGGRDTERTRNAVMIEGADYSDGDGAVRGHAYAYNAFQGSGDDPATRHPAKFSSNLIENGVDPDDGPLGNAGLDAMVLAAEILPDVNKEFVEATVPSWRDDIHGPGLTCLLDMLDRLAIGEPMWVVRYQWEVTDKGWIATYGMTGGGLPQTYTPPEV